MESIEGSKKYPTYQDIVTRARNILSRMHEYNMHDQETKDDLVDTIITDILQRKKIGKVRFLELQEETQEAILHTIDLTELFDGTSDIFDAHLQKLRAR